MFSVFFTLFLLRSKLTTKPFIKRGKINMTFVLTYLKANLYLNNTSTLHIFKTLLGNISGKIISKNNVFYKPEYKKHVNKLIILY